MDHEPFINDSKIRLNMISTPKEASYQFPTEIESFENEIIFIDIDPEPILVEYFFPNFDVLKAFNEPFDFDGMIEYYERPNRDYVIK